MKETDGQAQLSHCTFILCTSLKEHMTKPIITLDFFMAENLPSLDFFMAKKSSTFDFFIVKIINVLKHHV
jgi:hypothetical protein